MNYEQTPALREAVENMANMREAYNNISQAAEAYNTGKVELAANITAKGVQASKTETLPELAKKVSFISQDTYEINGGEMYAKQLFGSLETPNYWNLYEVLANLLSDGRLVSYGGILLAEYYRGYDSLALAGAGAGGAYVVSDKDENGQFKMYTEDTTHTWATEFDGKGNRWVAYCFADEYHDFQITDTNTCPRSIFIGRKVGTITSLVNGRVSQIIVPDGNVLHDFYSNYSQNFGKNFIIRNIETIGGRDNKGNSDFCLRGDSGIENMYIECGTFSKGKAFLSLKNLTCAIIKANEIYGLSNNFTFLECEKLKTIVLDAELMSELSVSFYNSLGLYLYLIGESVSFAHNAFDYSHSGIASVYCFYKTNDKTKSFNLPSNTKETQACRIVSLQDGWCKPMNCSAFTNLTEENMYEHILQRLKQDEPDCGDGVTITLGNTNLEKLTSQESQDLLAELRGTYGYTFA